MFVYTAFPYLYQNKQKLRTKNKMDKEVCFKTSTDGLHLHIQIVQFLKIKISYNPSFIA